jgi:transposase InsO family protein
MTLAIGWLHDGGDTVETWLHQAGDWQFGPSTSRTKRATAARESSTSCVAVLLDLYSRRVVGWAMRKSLSRELAVSALQHAVTRRRPPPGLVHHTDRGSPIRQLRGQPSP